MPERVRVVVRIRPFLPTDPAEADLSTVMLDDSHVTSGKGRVFRVDRAYKMEDDAAAIYESSVRPIVASFLDGCNATVMAYGQTGTGKTFTVSGLFPLIVGQVVNEGCCGGTDQLSFQYIEVYGDALRDLLCEDPAASAKNLQIYDAQRDGRRSGGNSPNSPSGGVPVDRPTGPGAFVAGALRVTAASLSEVFDIVAYGGANRVTGTTSIHQHSSRSHSVFTIFDHRSGAKMHLVDLAGSERNKKTNNIGQRFQESIAINGGLLALGNVIRALGRNHHYHTGAGALSSSHVPYRSSKLTRLLQDSLGGTATTLFICCVAPDSLNKDETLRSLQYCALAMKIVNAPTQQFINGARSQQQRGSLYRGGEEEERSGSGGGATPEAAADAAQLREELDMYGRFCEEQEAEIAGLRSQLSSAHAKLDLCESELRKDEAIFSGRIAEMERLMEENAELRRLLTMRRRSDQLVAAAPVPLGGLRSRSPDNPSMTPVPSAAEAMRDATPNSAGLEGYEKSLPYMRKTLKFSEAHHGDPLPTTRPSSSLRVNSSARDGRFGGISSGAAVQLADPSAEACDDQLLGLTREALQYQHSNTQLKQQLSSVTVALEAQQRETAMLRLELGDLHQLLQ